MKMFSDCSGPCETCRTHYLGGCLAGHGDDDYSSATIEWVQQLVSNLERTIERLKKFPGYKNPGS